MSTDDLRDAVSFILPWNIGPCLHRFRTGGPLTLGTRVEIEYLMERAIRQNPKPTDLEAIRRVYRNCPQGDAA